MIQREKEIAIVVIAYNRPHSLKRILGSIGKAYYPRTDIPLVISIDRGDNKEVLEIAEAFQWNYGDKRVLYQERNLGLRPHVLQCGNLTKEYENIIMLEDDIYVSPSFFAYTQQALEFVEENPDIAGVSLYQHLLNAHAREPFLPIDDGYDNWYMQMASSWGQAWTRRQWSDFYDWYMKWGSKDIASNTMPKNISSWSEKSWLKYFDKYLVETGKYFIYPRISLTTNFSDLGEHETKCINDLQVPMLMAKKKIYHFSTMEQSQSVYDIFYENQKLTEALKADCSNIAEDNVTIDLYGGKCTYKRYLLSSSALPYDVVVRYGRKLRPIDMNVMEHIDGNAFFLYDTNQPAKAPKEDKVQKYLYHYRAFKAQYGLMIGIYRIVELFRKNK